MAEAQLEHERQAAREAREASIGRRLLALEALISRTAELMKQVKRKELSRTLNLELRRSSLAPDLLHEAATKLQPAHMLFANIHVQFVNEPGRDEGALRINAFAAFHERLYTQPCTARFFQRTSSGGFVPVADASAKHLPPLMLPFCEGDEKELLSSREDCGDGGGGDGDGSHDSAAPRLWSVGQQVEAKYMAKMAKKYFPAPQWFPGRIDSAPDAEGRCNVRYDDGDFEELVPSNFLRLPRTGSRDDGERVPEVRASNARAGCEAAAGSPASASAAGRTAKRPRMGAHHGAGPSAAIGGVDGSEGDRMACDAETVYRLCGRVLAKALIEGVACCVDDKLPLFVLEYLATDNCTSLDTLDTALEQLRAVDAAHATFLETARTQTVASMAASLYEERLRTCELYSLMTTDDH